MRPNFFHLEKGWQKPRAIRHVKRSSRKHLQRNICTVLTAVYLLTLISAPLFHTCTHDRNACIPSHAEGLHPEGCYSDCSGHCENKGRSEPVVTEAHAAWVSSGFCPACLFNVSNQASKIPIGASILLEATAPEPLLPIWTPPRKIYRLAPANIRAPPLTRKPA